MIKQFDESLQSTADVLRKMADILENPSLTSKELIVVSDCMKDLHISTNKIIEMNDLIMKKVLNG